MNNPYIIVGIIIAIDIISIPFFIKSMLKKKIKRKGAVIASVLVAFIAVETAFSFFYIDSKQFYDREGNTYLSAAEVVYYDREGNKFLLDKSSGKYSHFVSVDGKRTLISERVYLDKDGYIVFDRDEELRRSDREYVYLDNEGNEYFLAEQMQWGRGGKIELADELR